MERSPTNIGIEISPTKPGVLSTTMGSYIMQWRLFGKDTWSKGEVDGDCSRLRLLQPIRSLFWFDTHDVLVTSLSFAGHKEMAGFNPKPQRDQWSNFIGHSLTGTCTRAKAYPVPPYFIRKHPVDFHKKINPMNPSCLQLLLMQSPIWELVNSISIELWCWFTYLEPLPSGKFA